MKTKKIVFYGLLLILSGAVVTGIYSTSLQDGKETGSYKVVTDWPKLPPDFEIGQVSGVDMDSKGNLWVFHRAGRVFTLYLAEVPTRPIAKNTILCIDGKTGELIKSFGADVFMSPHGLTLDSEDNVWVTDHEMHQVFKFSNDGKLLLTLGERGVTGNDETHFNGPADIAFSPNGDFFVADGYGNRRIAKFSKEGKYISEFGSEGDGNGKLAMAHGISLDEEGRIYVADRTNGCIQIFTKDGKFIQQWKSKDLGRPWAVHVSEDGFVFVVDGGEVHDSHDTMTPQRSRFLKLDKKGNILGTWGSYGQYPGQMIWPHDIVAYENSVFVGEVWWGMRVQKFSTP